MYGYGITIGHRERSGGFYGNLSTMAVKALGSPERPSFTMGDRYFTVRASETGKKVVYDRNQNRVAMGCFNHSSLETGKYVGVLRRDRKGNPVMVFDRQGKDLLEHIGGH